MPAPPVQARQAAQATKDAYDAPSGRQARRKLEVRRRIENAASALFAAQGVADTTVVEICKQADVAKASFFNHFPTRQALVCALAQSLFDELLIDIERCAAAEPSAAGVVRAFFRTAGERMAAQDDATRSLTAEMVAATQVDTAPTDPTDRLIEAWTEMLAQRAPGCDAETGAEMIVAAYFGLLMNWIRRERYEVTAKSACYAETICGGLELPR